MMTQRFLTADFLAEVLQDIIRTESSTYNNHNYTEPENSRAYDCKVPSCYRAAFAKGYCNAHYMRLRTGRDMEAPIKNRKAGADCLDCKAKATTKGGWLRCPACYKKRRQRLIKYVLVELLGGSCSNCGGIFPLSVYDFHHAEEKDANPAELIANSSIERLAEEISCCILLCANCHRLEHHDEL